MLKDMHLAGLSERKERKGDASFQRAARSQRKGVFLIHAPTAPDARHQQGTDHQRVAVVSLQAATMREFVG
jgi:hypothetical protein